MSYSQMDSLSGDALFGGRVRACTTEQAETYKDDGRANMVSAANDALRGGSLTSNTMTRLLSATPAFVATADDGSGGIDSAKITDGDILAAVQAGYPVVAGLYWNEDGTPIAGAGA